jgi:MoaA/NifB/PqqE/SkfB family radical SAM enzyme
VTNCCNASCDFCNFAKGKIAHRDLRWIAASRLDAALEILHRRAVRYISFFGGEPLLHPHLPEMVRTAVARGMGTALITNGWLLPSKLDELSAAGLKTIYISIDAPSVTAHEHNRGLKNLVERIRAATSRMQSLGITALAQVTMSKLIDDYVALRDFLRGLGFDAVAFSYPQRVRLGSTSLAWSDTSKLVNFTDPELASAFTSVDTLRRAFPVSNPSASIADMKRHLLGEPEHFVCYGGYKSFYLDWNFDLWRCDAWEAPMCSVWDFDKVPLIRDGCTACIADCYRDSSVMLHFAVSLGDAVDRAREGKFLAALKLLANRRNLESLRAVAQNASIRSRLAVLG